MYNNGKGDQKQKQGKKKKEIRIWTPIYVHRLKTRQLSPLMNNNNSKRKRTLKGKRKRT